jgi:hypothetical protein
VVLVGHRLDTEIWQSYNFKCYFYKQLNKNTNFTQGEKMNFQKMTKKQLESHGRTIGIELDRRKSKKDMITELNKASKTAKKKAPARKAPYVLPKLSFWGKVKKYLNL